MEIIFDYSELSLLLAKAGVNAPVGVGGAHFLPLTEAEKQASLQEGQAKMSAWEDADGQALVQILAEPTAVFHATRVRANQPDEDVWFFYTPSQTVQMQKAGEGQYKLTAVSGETAVLSQIQQFLPLQPAPAELTYRVRLSLEDFLTLRDLATEWNEVPALEILEADGLDQVTARDLFDSAVDPEWRGIIDFLTCQGQTVTQQTTLRVLQGAQISWVIRPSSGDQLIVETAQPGHYQNVLDQVWKAMWAE